MNSLLITFIASVLLSLSVTLAQESRTDRPIIGVVTLPFMGLAVAGGAARRRRLSAQNERPSSHHHHHHRHRHHDSDKEVKTMVDMAFAKWVMAAGARVAVIHYDLIADGCGHPNASMCEAGERKLRRMFDAVNGIVFQGGGANTEWENSTYYQTNKLLLKWAREENSKPNVTFPVHGTCLGFQSLLIAATEDHDLTVPTDSLDVATYLNMTEAGRNGSSFFREVPSRIMQRLENRSGPEEPIAPSGLGPDHHVVEEMVNMNHHYGVPCSKFEEDPKIKEGFQLLTTSTDKKGVCYASTFQGKGENYPITGTQWHPEKPGYEWELPAVPHHMDAIRLGQATASRLVSLARGNGHRPRDAHEETEILLYNYEVDFTAGPKYGGLASYYPYADMTKKVQDQLAVFDRSEAWKNNSLEPEYPSDHPHHDESNAGSQNGKDSHENDNSNGDEGTLKVEFGGGFGAGLGLGLLLVLVSHLCTICFCRRHRSNKDDEEGTRQPLII